MIDLLTNLNKQGSRIDPPLAEKLQDQHDKLLEEAMSYNLDTEANRNKALSVWSQVDELAVRIRAENGKRKVPDSPRTPETPRQPPQPIFDTPDTDIIDLSSAGHTHANGLHPFLLPF